MMKPWSFSSMNQYFTCPRQYDLTRNKRVIPYEETEATSWGNAVHAALEAALADDTPLEGNFLPYKKYADKVRGLPGEKYFERKVALSHSLTPANFGDDTVWCRGILDVCIVDGKRAFVGDWKTGKIRPDSDQLKLFAGFTMAYHPEVEVVKTSYLWVAHGKSTSEMYTRKDLPAIWQHFFEKARKIEESYKQDRWMPRPSGLCAGWCGARNHCEHWRPKR